MGMRQLPKIRDRLTCNHLLISTAYLRQRKDKHLVLVYTTGDEARMEHPNLSPELTVAEVMDLWPQTIPVFLRYRMACVGCPIASFETLAEIAAIYDQDLDWLLNELEQIIQSSEREST